VGEQHHRLAGEVGLGMCAVEGLEGDGSVAVENLEVLVGGGRGGCEEGEDDRKGGEQHGDKW